ncbi:MAG: HD domain-containing protein [Candidatus Omnitrophica bacterium]|nr:HD domain-containing protein [Candidatus Omnitrophota bacterium]
MNASKGMIRVKDPVILLKIITRYIDRKMGVTHVGVLLFDKARHAYVLIDSKGEGGTKIPVGYVKIHPDNPIVSFFTASDKGALARKEALVYGELEPMRNFEILVNRKERRAIHYEDVRMQMSYLRAAVCVPSFYKKELIGILILGNKLSGEPYEEEEINLFVTLANDVAMAVKNAELIQDLKHAYEKEHRLFIQTAIALATAIDARDRYTHGHSERVSHYSMVLVKELVDAGRIEYDRELMEAVQLSALLHDIGKIGIRDQILNKPATLTPEEFEVMKTHVTIGASIVKPVKGLTHLEDGILYHHERYDGQGYPFGLKGDEIPLVGRIVNVTDSYDTMITARAYKRTMAVEEAFEELKRCVGTQFDPEMVEAFCRAYEKGDLTKRQYAAFDFAKLH